MRARAASAPGSRRNKLADALGSQILERKTLDRIFDYVKYNEVPLVEDELAVVTARPVGHHCAARG